MRPARRGRRRPPATGIPSQRRRPRKTQRGDINSHSACHVIARARQYVRPVRAPLHLAHRILVSGQMGFAHAAHRWGLRRLRAQLHHAAVPDLDRLVDARAREEERPVLVPVEREDLAAGCGDGECGRGERRGESVCARAGGSVCGGTEVKDLERAVGGAGCDDVGLVWGEEGLVDAGRMRLEGCERPWTVWRPLRVK